MKDVQSYAVHGPAAPVAVGTAVGCHEALPDPNNSRAGETSQRETMSLLTPCVRIVLKLDRGTAGIQHNAAFLTLSLFIFSQLIRFC